MPIPTEIPARPYGGPPIELATGRKTNIYADDIATHIAALRDAIAGRRILIIGGAGSIGAATVERIAAYGPAMVHVVDLNENGLVELVRSLRSGPADFMVPDFRLLPIDFGSPVMRRFVRDEGPWDAILNFAALKHVRSEKDVYSLLRMIDTNVLAQARLLDCLAESGKEWSYFSVSTDKAANPASLMGATKRLMELVMFAKRRGRTVSSARFANVAFSDGSLLHGFLGRLAKNQPLAAPRDARRYFISPEEAADVCLLAAFAAPGNILVPRGWDGGLSAVSLETVAAAILRARGFEPAIYSDETAARRAIETDPPDGRYPLLLTPRDTAGEKEIEIFVGSDESPHEAGMSQLLAVDFVSSADDSLADVLIELNDIVSGGKTVGKNDIVKILQRAVPTFAHLETGRSLDERM